MNVNQVSQINKYIKTNSSAWARSSFPLEKIDLKKIEGIQADIPLFAGVNLESIKFLTKWFQVLNLTRGCREQCTFCLRNAKTPLKETHNTINTILWEDLTRFTEGFRKLGERLGVNLFQGNSHITLFEDANLPDAIIKDKNGTEHSIKNVIQNIYENIRLPFVFVTSGWDVNNKKAQKTAEEICDYVLQTPDCTKEFGVSINPFFVGTREKYIEKIVNTLKTFLPLFKTGEERASILLKYNYPNGINADKNGQENAFKLYIDIFEQLQNLCGSSLERYEYLNPKKILNHRVDNYIENKGRGQRFFSSNDVKKNNNKLFVESFEWMTLTPEQKKEYAYNYTTKNIDINGKIYLITPSEQVIETDSGLNFINKDKKTDRIHSDIKFYNYIQNH